MAPKNTYHVTQLLERMKDPDADLRFMALKDLIDEVNSSPNSFAVEEAVETGMINQIIDMLSDVNSEVKNKSVLALTLLVNYIAPARLEMLVERLCGLAQSRDESVSDVAIVALKNVILQIPPTAPSAASVTAFLVPRLVAQVSKDSGASSATGALSTGALDILTELFTRFPAFFAAEPGVVQGIYDSLTALLGNSRSAVNKRVIGLLVAVAVGTPVSGPAGTTGAAPATPATSPLFLSHLLSTHVYSGLASSDIGKIKTSELVLLALSKIPTPQTASELSHIISPLIKLSAETERFSDDPEVIELALQALEGFVANFSEASAPFVPQLVAAAVRIFRFDPNYAGDDDMIPDDISAASSTYSDLDEYSDDDDTSWKARKAAVKLVTTLAATRTDLAAELLRVLEGPLVSRFSEREDTVRIDILGAYRVILQTNEREKSGESGTRTYHAKTPEATSRLAKPVASSLKRKHGQEEAQTSDVEMGEADAGTRVGPRAGEVYNWEGVVTDTLAPSPVASRDILAALTAQLNTKNTEVQQAVLQVLAVYGVARPLGPTDLAPLVAPIEAVFAADASGFLGNAAALKMDALSFLTVVFSSWVGDEPAVISAGSDSTLPRLAAVLVSAVSDRFNRIAAETLRAVSALAAALPRLGGVDRASLTRALYEATAARVASPTADDEVKSGGIEAVAWLYVACAAPVGQDAGHTNPNDVFSADNDPLAFLTARLENETTRLAAARAVPRVASVAPEEWLARTARDLAAFVRLADRALKTAALVALRACVARGALRPDDAGAVVDGVLAAVTRGADVRIVAVALHALAAVAAAAPTASDIYARALPALSAVPRFTTVTRAVVDAEKAAFAAFSGVLGGLKVYEALVTEPIGGQGSGETSEVRAETDSGMAIHMLSFEVLGCISECVGAVAARDPSVVPEIVTRCVGASQGGAADAANTADAQTSSPQLTHLLLSLLILGQVGRVSGGVSLDSVEVFFTHPVDDVRTASAIAAGNIAVGQPDLVPGLLAAAGSTPAGLCALQAVQTFVSFVGGTPSAESGTQATSPDSMSATIWRELLSDPALLEEEKARSLVAACLGEIATRDPSTFLPELQKLISSQDLPVRLAVISASRFVFTSHSVSDAETDELYVGLLLELCRSLEDADLETKKTILIALNAVAQSNRVHLLRDDLGEVLPFLYQQMQVDERYVRIVEMGPFKHRIDDGLEVRGFAYDILHGLLEKDPQDINTDEALEKILLGMSDEEEIAKKCYLMLVILGEYDGPKVVAALDRITPLLKKPLSTVLKDTAVKQEIERLAEFQKGALRCTVALTKLEGSSANAEFSELIDMITEKAGGLAREHTELVSLIQRK